MANLYLFYCTSQSSVDSATSKLCFYFMEALRSAFARNARCLNRPEPQMKVVSDPLQTSLRETEFGPGDLCPVVSSLLLDKHLGNDTKKLLSYRAMSLNTNLRRNAIIFLFNFRTLFWRFFFKLHEWCCRLEHCCQTYTLRELWGSQASKRSLFIETNSKFYHHYFLSKIFVLD